MEDPITIRLMEPADLDTLRSICLKAYSQNFGHHWTEGGLADYLEKVFAASILAAELADPNIRFYVAFRSTKAVAFMKLNLHSNLPGNPPEKGIELDKLYILPASKGQKIGARMMDLAFRLAEMTAKDDFWLTVIDTNTPAIAFYEKYGFRFHSITRVPYHKFRDELKGMWRMHTAIKKVAGGL
jgi:ribosomal protein S18 acetylase RimI-like enzyme